MANEDREPTKYEKVKKHLKVNKKIYLAAGGGVVVGAAGLFFATGGHVVIVDGIKLIHVQWHSPNTTIVQLERSACPDPIPVRHKPTGEDFRSIRRASAVTGRNATQISEDIHGLAEEFERLPETVFA